MIKQALILAGGLGTRLGAITQEVPKPMVSVGNKPFLERLMFHLSQQGIQDFVLCIGYLAEKIQNHFGDGKSFGWNVQYTVEKELLGTGGAIQKASSLLQENFLVISGDNYLELDYINFMETFEAKQKTGMLAVWTNNPPLFRSNVELELPSGRIKNYHFSDTERKNFVDVGVKAFSRKLFSYFPDKEKFSLEVDVLPQIASDGELLGYPVKNPPLDVGTLEGLETVRKTLVNA